MKNVIVLAIFLLEGALCQPASALEGLARLQKAALNDQACECMVHEYARRYNEVLRQYLRDKRKLSEQDEARAHAEAVQWVRSVWQFADQGVVEKQLSSEQFISATTVFRQSQHAAYPNLPVVP